MPSSKSRCFSDWNTLKIIWITFTTCESLSLFSNLIFILNPTLGESKVTQNETFLTINQSLYEIIPVAYQQFIFNLDQQTLNQINWKTYEYDFYHVVLFLNYLLAACKPFYVNELPSKFRRKSSSWELSANMLQTFPDNFLESSCAKTIHTEPSIVRAKFE